MRSGPEPNRVALVLVVIASLWLSAGIGQAASPAENRAFDAAARSFNDGFFERTEREWGEFIRQFPGSERVSQAVLYQAQARLRLGRNGAAVQLLEANLGRAGKLSDQYWYWIAEAEFQRGGNPAAAQAYARLANDFPRSPLRLKAAFGEAIAWFKAGDSAKALDGLQRPDGPFQAAAQSQPRDESVARGYLLIAEILLQRRDYPGTTAALHRLDNAGLDPDLKWKKQYLTIQTLLAEQRLDAAFQDATNLMAWTVSTGVRALQEETVALQGDILQKLGQPEAAIQVFTNNLAPGVPPDRQRQALLKVIELSLTQDKTKQALDWLRTYLRERPKDPNLDLVRLTLGELQLKTSAGREGTNGPAIGSTPAVPMTNLLAEARAQFDEVITNFPQSPLVGKAHLDRGWCLWEAGAYSDSGIEFRTAAARLPLSEDQAVARFKWADAQFQTGDFAGAITNYEQVLEYASTVPGLPSTVFEQALYQIVRAGIRSGNQAATTNALAQILSRFPDSQFCDDSLLLVGQDLGRRGHPAAARKVFADFLERYPDSSLAPEARLAIARTYVRDGDLPHAIETYDAWVTHFTNHPALAQAEFDRAWLTYQAGKQSNAVSLLTHYVAGFPNSTNAPLAQFLIGGYFFDRGDFANAELNYRLLIQNTNWPTSDLTYQARLMAGRAAFARGSFDYAKEYFLGVINFAPSPDLVAQAYLHLGDTVVEAPPKDPAKPLDKYREAIGSFSKIPSTNDLAPRALGRKADCYLQLATEDKSNYDRAAEFYAESMRSPLADPATRSRAEVGLGIVLEKQAQESRVAAEPARFLDQAQDHYLNVVYGKNLHDAEQADPYWIGQAGLAAGRLLEKREKWEQAARVYERLITIPPLRAAAESKLAALKARLSATNN